MQIREHRFLVSTDPLYRSLWTSSVVLLTTRVPRISLYSAYLFRSASVRGIRLPGRSLLGSAALHGIAILLLVRFVQIYGTAPPPADMTSVMDDTYYPLPPLPRPEALPKITPQGPGGKPGRAEQPQEDPNPGSSSLRRDLTVISNTSHPDNRHQTIIQPKSPPDLIIKQDLKLPNLVLGNPLPTLTKPQVQFPSSLVKPIAATHANNDPAAPQPVSEQQTAQLTMIAATVPIPRLALPLPSATGSKPVRGGSGASGSAAASALEAPAVAGNENTGPSNGVLILGTDPAGAGTPVILPPGNRYGSFSISAAGGESGSPGGVAGGVSGGGTAGVGDAGDESSGVGNENTGGGGGGPANGSSGISVTGPGAISGGQGDLVGSIPADAIYPVIRTPHIQRNTLTISTGGAGGGGLGVYQALQCNRIYTIFVPMPTSTWTLQYCQQNTPSEQPLPQSSASVTTHFTTTQEALLAPDPLEEFDFRRTPLTSDLTNKMLILKGVIRDDGAVDKLEVYQGVMKQMDDIALAALRKWKFAPAKRGGKPVAVQILVGIQLSGSADR